jgi:hypothetical protein
VLAVLARTHQRLIELAAELRRRPEVRSAVTAVTPRRYPDGDRVECYMDAELMSGHSIGAWLEFTHDAGSWVIEASIRHSGDQGEDELVGLPSRFAVEDEELFEELDAATSALVEAVRALDLTHL